MQVEDLAVRVVRPAHVEEAMALRRRHRVPEDQRRDVSRTARQLDRTQKMPIYAREKVPYVWIVDPRDRTVEVFRLGAEGYVLTKTWSGDDAAVLEPFEALPIPPSAFWGKRKAR